MDVLTTVSQANIIMVEIFSQHIEFPLPLGVI